MNEAVKQISGFPIISVLTPAYNAEHFIEEAIESILRQTFRDFELIIIDDCSIDKTWDIIQKYAMKDKRIKAFRNKKNLYIAGNRNKLLKLARGKYIVWQDADDISLPNRLKHQYNFMEKNPKVGIVGGFLQFFNEQGNMSVRKYAFDDKTLRKNIFKFSPVAQPASMIRKECLDKVGEYNLQYPPAEDIDMSFRIGLHYQFANLHEVVIKYRQNSQSATFTRLQTIERNTLQIRKKYSSQGGYLMSLGDKIYNTLQFFSLYFVPSVFKIKIFNIIRNSRNY